MFTKLRRKLAAKLLPKDADTLYSFGAWCFTRAMQQEGCEYAQWELGSHRYEVYDVTHDEPETVNLRCEICTHEFEADADVPVRCPNCHSSDVELVI